MASLSKRMTVQGYKCGPDFIDPMFHALATGRPGRNLDGFMMPHAAMESHFQRSSRDADISIFEGVRGLYESLDWDVDTGSTAEIAKLLDIPVLLMINTRSLTRSAAALVKGFRALDPDVNLAGVILNNVSGPSHQRKASKAIEELAGIEVVGTIWRNAELTLPTLPTEEGLDLDSLSKIMMEEIDVERILSIAESAPAPRGIDEGPPAEKTGEGLRAAVPLDPGFNLYYPEHLETMRSLGAEVIHYSPCEGESPPEADLHYLGGGRPDLFARELSENHSFIEALSNAAAEGIPVVAEGEGSLTLCRNLIDLDGERYPMAGLLPADGEQCRRRQGLSYVIAKVRDGSKLFPVETFHAHEFHYSRMIPDDGAAFCYDVLRGKGITARSDGLRSGSALGSLMHQHVLSSPWWVPSLLRAAAERPY